MTDRDLTRVRREPISARRILDTALAIVEREGFDALTMRRVAAALDTGPASLYAHVRNKADLDDLLIAELSRGIEIPRPDGRRWRSQILDVCRALRDQYLRFPGISRAALEATPHSADAIRLMEGMLALVLAGGVRAKDAAWAIDAANLYVAAYCLEASMRRHPIEGIDDRLADREDTIARFRALPADRFPLTVAHARELTSGEGHERFDFTLDLLFRGLATRSSR